MALSPFPQPLRIRAVELSAWTHDLPGMREAHVETVFPFESNLWKRIPYKASCIQNRPSDWGSLAKEHPGNRSVGHILSSANDTPYTSYPVD